MQASDLDILLPQPAQDLDLSTRWGAVSAVSPLRVRLDGDDTHMPVTPASLVGGLTLGARVLVLLAGRQMIVTGVYGGAPGVPPGAYFPYGGTVAPAGYLLFVGGEAVSRSTYPALFAAIGTTWGAGDGSTTFNLPPVNGRMLVGRDPSQAEFSTLGKIGGAKAVALTVEQMPSHSHTVYGRVDRYQGAGTVFREPTDAPFATSSTSTAASGGGAAHENMPPYLVSIWIIKT